MSSGPSCDAEPGGLRQIGCAALAVVVGALPFGLWFGVPWWMNSSKRAAEGELRKTMTAALQAAARTGDIDRHAAFRAALASASHLRLFSTDADGVRIEVEQYGNGSVGSRSGYDLCLRFTVTRSTKPKVEASERDRCADPSGGRAQAAERIGREAEKARGGLAAAVTGGSLTRERAHTLVRGDLGDLWSFHPSVIVVDYIALARTGAVEDIECVHFVVARDAKNPITMYRAQECPDS